MSTSTIVISSKEFELYEKRIDNCLKARDMCSEDSWAYQFWQRTAMTLLRTLNRKMSGYK